MTVEYHSDLLPERVACEIGADEVLEMRLQASHKGGAWGDAVAVKGILTARVFEGAFPFGRFLRLGGFLRRAEPTRALLVHLGAGGAAVNCHVEHFQRLDDLLDAVR